MEFTERVRAYAALGDEHRLKVVDALRLTDLTFSELAEITGLGGNLLAHHLGTLEAAGLLARRSSEGDGRRRYVHLNAETLNQLGAVTGTAVGLPLFVCTHNSARSQFAAALWRSITGLPADSAGSDPAESVHPKAVRMAREFEVDLTIATPKGYSDVTVEPDVVVSVCDRAREADHPSARAQLHWSVPDPVRNGSDAAFRSAFAELHSRVLSLASNSAVDK